MGRLEEGVRIIKGLWADGPLTFAGRHYTITAMDGAPKPLQRPRPPIHIGAGGKRMLAFAAREADIVGVLNASVASGALVSDPAAMSPARLAEKVGWVREAAGARFAGLELSAIVSVVLAEERRAAAERFAAAQGWHGVGADEVLAMPSVFIGTVDRIAEEMRERREQYGFSYYVVSDEDPAAFAPVVAQLAGR